MNERIRELAEQAKNFMTDQVLYQSRVYNRTLSVDESADIFEEKFAELIVEECVGIVENKIGVSRYVHESELLRECSSTIKEHFGVES